MNRLLVLSFCLFIVSNVCASDINFTYSKTEDGVVLLPKADYVTNTAYIKIQVVTDKIIRVVAAPQKNAATANSLITNYTPASQATFDLLPSNGEKLTLKTQWLTINIDLNTGAVSFFDAAGKPVLNERKVDKSLSPVVHEGSRSYEISQTFETTADDAWYGLGQHQDGLFNYKGYQVNLFQNNTEVAVPFLISTKNYGILWDNYSITKVGDTRDYKPLKAIKLYAADGQPGWLSTYYCNDKTKPGEAVLERAESEIKMEFLGDSKLQLPGEFSPAKGLVKWEGAIGSEIEGGHKMRFTYGGYIKVWFDNKLVLDRWRQCWNPGSAILNFDMVKGKKYPFKIEWVPDGGESYISVKWMEPTEEKNENSFGFKSEAGQQEDYYFVYGSNMDDVISGYRLLTGKAVMLPKWALGFWQSRERYKTQEEILNTVSEFRKRKIPLDNIVLDWNYWKEDQWGSQQFDAARFPNPDSMIKVIHEKYHAQLMISVWPKFYEGITSYKLFDKNGWLYKRNIADRQRDWIAKGYVSTFYDPFNAAARRGFWNLLDDNLYKKGVDAWWMDASEPDILSNVSAEKRKEQMYPLAAGITAEYLNAYPLENAKGIYEGQRETNPDKRVFILTRSGFAGMQRYAAATWSGDISSRWHDMQNQVSAGINFSMSGMPYWTMDAGGFAVEDKYLHPTAEESEEWRELMTRWYQFGAFVPLFRVHGQPPSREIYNVAPESHPAYKSMLYYGKLRYRLMPYIYSVAAQIYLNNYTLMRGLVMDFANDAAVKNISDEYMFGPSLLVSPVFNYKQRSRTVYLPKGEGWYNLYTGTYLQGGQSVNADAAYEQMPVFVKAGAIIPFGPELQYTAEKKADTISLYVYAGKDGAFTLYEDEGTNYNYEKGISAQIKFSYSEADQTITIHAREGAFPGMLQKRYFSIKYNRKGSETSLDLSRQQGILITYNGKKQLIHLK